MPHHRTTNPIAARSNVNTMRPARRWLAFFVLILMAAAGSGAPAQDDAAAAAAQAPPTDFQSLFAQAERLYSDGSYRAALDLYKTADRFERTPLMQRWLDFRLADLAWRAADPRDPDTTVIDNARKALTDFLAQTKREEDRDRIWALAQESLGDSYFVGPGRSDYASAQPYYRSALEFWENSNDLEQARDAYLGIIWKIVDHTDDRYSWQRDAVITSVRTLENVLKIARNDAERGRAHYLIAMALMRSGTANARDVQRVSDEMEPALKLGADQPWLDDAIYAYARWVEAYGHVVVAQSGQWTFEPDYEKALDLYKRIVVEFKPSTSPHYDSAKAAIRGIIDPSMSISVGQAFLPDSLIQFRINWRNVEAVDLALYRVDLTSDVSYVDTAREPDNWIDRISYEPGNRERQWQYKPAPARQYTPGRDSITLDEPLPVGAYLLVASTGGIQQRELVLVTDLALVIKRIRDRMLVFACDALTGKPVVDTTLSAVVRRWDDNEKWIGTALQSTTDENGLCEFEIPDQQARYNQGILLSARADQRQAFCQIGQYWYDWQRNRTDDVWKIYAQTDRPAYRPGDTVKFKFTARNQTPQGLTTPDGRRVYYYITDPRGGKITEDTVTLNAFGSAWDDFEVPADAALGEFYITFCDPDKNDHAYGRATLFRIEEYKLPEFSVTVETGKDENGKPKTFRVGDTIEADIVAQYYSGPPVANASVEVVIYQNPYYRYWSTRRDYPWYYEDNSWRYYGWGHGQTVSTQTVKTDAQGKAVVRFQTPSSTDQDYEYEIEARVTDQSRREIVESGTVRVTRQSHFVNPKVTHNITRPGDKVEVTFDVADANDQPLALTGKVTISRRWWKEIWLDPAGRLVQADEIERIRKTTGFFPPPPGPDDRRPWTPWKQGYESEVLQTTELTTDKDGHASMTFTPTKPGYYEILWVSPDPPTVPVTAQTFAWVSTDKTESLGYRTGQVEIIVDKDTVRAGGKTPVMLVSPVSDRYVLFTIEGNDLYEYRVVHVTGTVKLLELEMRDAFLPNVYLNATLVSGGSVSGDTKELVIPPDHKFINVSVVPDTEIYEPGGHGQLTVTTTDRDGQPVSAEVAMSVFDRSVLYIASSYSGDPRQFFYGDKQGNFVWTENSFNYRRYAKLVRDPDGNVTDVRDLWQAVEQRELEGRAESERLGIDAGEKGMASLRYDGAPARRGMARSSPGSGSIFKDESDAQFTPASAEMSPGKPVAPRGPEDKKAGFEPENEIKVRSDFRATALWIPDVRTDSNGTAVIDVDYPESLTAWDAVARAATADSKFGQASATTRTSKGLTVRIQGPRFLVHRDRFVISYLINNNTDERIVARPELKADDVQYLGVRLQDGQYHYRVSPDAERVVEAHGEIRVDCMYAALQEGEFKVTATVQNQSGSLSDGVEHTYPVVPHGIEKLLAVSGKVDASEAWVSIDVPTQRDKQTTKFTVTVTPSLATSMLDALPYLINYPYGCTEQTMSRFLPTIITLKTLQDMGVDPEDVASRAFGGIEALHAADTHPDGKQDLENINAMAKASLDRLMDFQHGDGGWGWWKQGPSDDYMSAYVLWGLARARDAGVDVSDDSVRRAAAYLGNRLVLYEKDPAMQAWILHAITAADSKTPLDERSKSVPTALDNVYSRRADLGAYARALLALSMHRVGDDQRARVVAENLANGVTIDDAPDQSVLIRDPAGLNPSVMATAHWGGDRVAWRWTSSKVEATAMTIAALSRIDPNNRLIEPAVNWLVKNRRGAQWSNTRDTAIAVLALNDYLSQTGQTLKPVDYEVDVNGRLIGRVQLTPAQLIAAPVTFEVPVKYIADGENKVRLVRRPVDGENPDANTGAMYFAVAVVFFSREEPIKAAGNEIFVRRDYYRLVETPTLLGGIKYVRVPLGDRDKVQSGERIEVVLTIDAKNDYEYLVFEDLKPAGFESVQVQSGQDMRVRQLKASTVEREIGDGAINEFDKRRDYRPGSTDTGSDRFTGVSRWVHQELRDRLVALFIDSINQGVWEMRYELRAETPGTFFALPTLGHAMYVPELRCNGDEIRFEIEDRPMPKPVMIKRVEEEKTKP